MFLADVVAAAVLSGNRNFEGRVHALTRANYLASPPLVVAYALAGTVSSCGTYSRSCRRKTMAQFLLLRLILILKLSLWELEKMESLFS